MFSKSALVLTTAAAIALTSFDLRPAQAAPDSGPAIARQNGADEFSAQRKRRRGGVHPAVPLAAFGVIAGTIAGMRVRAAPRLLRAPVCLRHSVRLRAGGLRATLWLRATVWLRSARLRAAAWLCARHGYAQPGGPAPQVYTTPGASFGN